MSFNRIAVYGHRGWASSAIVNALAATGAPIRVLHRPFSDISSLPPGVKTVSVHLEDEQALINALKDVDIVISLVGPKDIYRQLAFVKAIPKTDVKLFVPSDLGCQIFSVGLTIFEFRTKLAVEKAVKDAGIPITLIWPGGLAETTLSVGLLGVDYTGNRIVFTGDSRTNPTNICTRKYVAAAYADIFARTPPSHLQGRSIGLSELKATGQEIFDALRKRHGKGPQTFIHSIDKVVAEIQNAVYWGDWLAPAWYYRRMWGIGTSILSVGRDIWEVHGYQKATLEELLVEGKLEPYRVIPFQMIHLIGRTFH